MSSMLAEERQREILTRVQRKGSVRVADLARTLEVTEETIRRDLDKLGSQGRIRRIHGGALPLEDQRRELPFGIRETVNLRAKQTIAQAALRFIEKNDTIALDASSSACELARVLPDIPMTVVSNAMPVTAALLERQHVRVISTGGLVDAMSLSYVGALAERTLGRFNIQKVFLSCKGLDLDRGLSIANSEYAHVKEKMIEIAQQVYLLVDDSKIDVRSVEFFAPLTDVDVIITNAERSTRFEEAMQRANVEIVYAG